MNSQSKVRSPWPLVFLPLFLETFPCLSFRGPRGFGGPRGWSSHSPQSLTEREKLLEGTIRLLLESNRGAKQGCQEPKPAPLTSEPSSDGWGVSCRAQGCVRDTQLLHPHTPGDFGVSPRGMFRVWYKPALMCGGLKGGKEMLCVGWDREALADKSAGKALVCRKA